MTNETTPHENGVDEMMAIAAATAAETTTTSTAAAEPAEPSEPSASPPAPSFDDLGLHPDIKLALDEMGYFAPTPVQTAVYGPVSEGKDLLVQSKTGTGKTTAFGLPALSKIVPTHRQPQVLILAPTRELALQVARELTQIGKHRGLVVEAIYGGAPIGKQITNLRNGVHVVVGTPGRVLDHIGRRTLDTKTITTFILDECDEMLSMGFLEDIERVVSHLPDKKQTLLFSATMPDEVARYSRRHMVAPEQISLSRDSISVTDIHHAYYIVSGIARSRDLLKIIYAEEPESAIIFCNMRDETTMVAKFLQKQGLDAEPLSSDLSQSDRERVMARTKAKTLRFLCATDVAARGIDISNLSHVINYSVPESPEVYVHRTGRTGRAGKKGTALSLVGPRELGNFRYVRLQFGIKPEERLLPKDDIFLGKLKTPLPPVGIPQPPDPVQILIRGVPGTASELETKIFEKLYSTANGKRVLAQLVAERLDKLSTRSKPKRERTERPEGDAAAEGGERKFDGERPRFDRGDRPERSDRSDRPEGDRPRRFDGERGDRPRRFDGDRPERGDRPEGDRPRRFDRDGERGDRPRRFDGDRPDRGERGDRPEGDRPRPDGDRPRPDGDRPRPDGDRPRRFDGDRPERGDRERRPWGERGEGRRGDRDRGERRDETAPVTEATAATTEVAEVAAETSTEIRTERTDGPEGGRDRDRDRGDRGGRDRHEARDRGGDRDRPRDRDRGRHDRYRGDRERTERIPRDTLVETAHQSDAPLMGESSSATIEVPVVEPETAKVDEVARAAVERADRGDRKAPKRDKKSEKSEETREFWETWAEEKSTRPEPAAAEPVKAGAETETEERSEGRSRDRGRGRDKDRGRDKRSRDKADVSDDKGSRIKREVSAPAPAPAAEAGQARLFVSLGKKHGVTADDLRTLLAAPIGGDKTRIGSVSLRDSHAHVRVPEEHVDAIIEAVNGTKHEDHDVTVERARA